MDSGYLDQSVARITIDKHKYIMGLQIDFATENRKLVQDWLERETMIECAVQADAGTTVFLRCRNNIDTREFARELVKKTGTLVVPGSVFGNEGAFNNFFRIGYMVESQKLKNGLENISSLLNSNLDL